MTAPRSEDAHPRVLAGRFELRHVLGAGGMATVWSAFDRRLGRTVAVKTLRDDLPEAHADRIRREARAAARIDDPRVVTVLDLEHDGDGTPFLVLEALEGRTLADELRDGPLPQDRAHRLVDDLLGGLAAAHQCGVLHRDIKPSNLLVADDGYRLIDFGIASLDDESATNGDLIGTLVYLAPERFDGAPATPRSDVFAAGAVLHEALSGRQPFRGATAAESMERLRCGRFPALPDHVPPQMARAVAMALDPDPARRPTDAAAFQRLTVSEPLAATQPLAVGEVTAPLPATAAGDRGAVVPAHGPERRHRAGAGEDTVLVDPTLTAGPPPARDRAGGVIRRRQGIAVAAAVLLLIGVVLAATSDGSSAPPAAGAGEPALELEAHLDRIQEIGR